MWIDPEVSALFVLPLVEMGYRRKGWRRVPDADLLVSQAKECLVLYRAAYGDQGLNATDFLAVIDDYLDRVLTPKTKTG